MRETVIVVDDEPSCLTLFREALAYGGREAVTFGSVADCLERLEETIRRDAPLAMIIDVLMPEADGIELLRGLAERKAEIPIIVTSARGEHYIRAASRLGTSWNLTIAATLAKPIDHRRLDEILSDLSRQRSTSGA